MSKARKVSFECPKCGKVDRVTFDGYDFGDRLLEGVKFHGVLEDGKLQVSVEPKDEAYFKTLNEKKWLREAKAFLIDTDVVTCAKCGEEAAVKAEGAPPPPPVTGVVTVPLASLAGGLPLRPWGGKHGPSPSPHIGPDGKPLPYGSPPPYELDKGRIGVVEHGISPPLESSVTIPVLVDGKDIGVVVYVATSPFAKVLYPGADNAARRDKAMREAAKRLSL
jgi:hypothetical protein